jgi:hypothetical protein
MTRSPDDWLARWHRIVAERDMEALRDVLALDVTMGAPPYWNKLQGRDVVHHLLGLIVDTIEEFTYHREWRDGAELALEFRGHVGDRDLQGIDLITLDENGRVSNLDVLMRPVNGVIALREIVAPKMVEFFTQRGQGAG